MIEMEECTENMMNETETVEETIELTLENLKKMVMTHPDFVPMVLHEVVEKYKPMVYGCLKEVFNILKDYVDNKEIFELMAREKKNTYDAYITVGFTEEQAFNLLMRGNASSTNKYVKDLNTTMQDVLSKLNK